MVLQTTWIVLVLGLSLGTQVQTGEIMGGHKAIPHSRPYMVLLKLTDDLGNHAYCDGFLITNEFVLTAAHCKASCYQIFLGIHQFKNQTHSFGVKKAIPHVDFDGATGMHDIMLLKLNRTVKYSNNISPIQLAGASDNGQRHDCTVSGWGRTSDAFSASVLMEVNVTLVPCHVCETFHFYCSIGKNGPSHGDSGGPLVCGDEVAHGIVSRGNGTFNVYLQIPYYRKWIDENIHEK